MSMCGNVSRSHLPFRAVVALLRPNLCACGTRLSSCLFAQRGSPPNFRLGRFLRSSLQAPAVQPQLFPNYRSLPAAQPSDLHSLDLFRLSEKIAGEISAVLGNLSQSKCLEHVVPGMWRLRLANWLYFEAIFILFVSVRLAL